MKCSDLIVKRGAAQARRQSDSRAQGHAQRRGAAARPACHFCGNCMAGCDVVAKYNSADVHMIPALKTGHLEIRSEFHRARGDGVRRESRHRRALPRPRRRSTEGEVRARSVVVACACVQSVALLLMSKSRLYPDGLANSSGELGRNFIPHFTGGVQCFLNDLIGKPTTDDEGFLDHAYVPSFMHTRKRDYARSFGVQFNYQNRRSVGWARSMPGFGKEYKQSVKERYPAFLIFSPYGEMLPNKRFFVDLDYDEEGRVRAAAGAAAGASGARTTRRFSPTCSAGRWRF